MIGYFVATPGDDVRICGVILPGPDYAKYRPLLERAGMLWREAEEASTDDYPGCWFLWNQAIHAIGDLGLRIGEPGYVIDNFEIDHDGNVEFDLEGWWMPDFG